jgi:Type I restriction enzyme R protein N terminus (HSDR_N)
MRQPATVASVADEILNAILAAPKKQRRLLSKTFWEKFDFKVRSKDRIEVVRVALVERHIRVIEPQPDQFGTEGRDSWVVLAYYPEADWGEPVGAAEAPEMPARPDNSWFNVIERRIFENEREVEHYFALPLLEALGYVEQDIYVGAPVEPHEGISRRSTHVDVAVYDGDRHDKGNALLVVEAKSTGRKVDDDAVAQARSYALWLLVPYFLITNGNELRVYAFRGGLQDLKVLTVRRSQLRARWGEVASLLHRGAVVARKARLVQALDEVRPG